jgi:hypothetical protein
MEIIAKLKTEIKEDLCYSADFQLRLLKSEIDKIREKQIYHNIILSQNNLLKMINNFSRPDSLYDCKTLEDETVSQTKLILISNAIIRDYYKKPPDNLN